MSVKPAHSQSATTTTETPDASITQLQHCSATTDNRPIKYLEQILFCISQYVDEPRDTINYYRATDALIRFIDRIDRSEYCPGGHDPRSVRPDLIEEIRHVNAAVNTALSTPKDTDYWVLDRRVPYQVFLPYRNHLIHPEDRANFTTESAVKIDKVITFLAEHRDWNGPYGHDELFGLTEEILNLGNDLYWWGMDTFLTSARGYAIYQLVRSCLPEHHFPSNTARAYAARTAAESEQYFYIQLERLGAARANRIAFQRWDTEKTIIGATDGSGFPREIYLGTNVTPREGGVSTAPGGASGPITSGPTSSSGSTTGPSTAAGTGGPTGPSPAGPPTPIAPATGKCKELGTPFENWYGKLAYDARIWDNYPRPDKSGFSPLENPRSDCESKINPRGQGAINSLMTPALQGLGPTSGLDEASAEFTLRRIADAINNHISVLTFEKLTEECLTNTQVSCPQAPGAAFLTGAENMTRQIRGERPVIVSELSALGAMAQAMKDILARRSVP
jgi:hypothetical protein